MIINKLDNVEISLENGHKYALCDIKAGENVIKYGCPIGHATVDIKKGEHVHTHNLKTNLSINLTYHYFGGMAVSSPINTDKTFLGYKRENGDVGIRNEIWIIPTVGCVNKIAERLADKTGAHAFVHPFGCSQLGDDQKTTQLVLRGLVNHPNAGGVLVLGLGCENNNIAEFKNVLGEWNENRVKFLVCQEHENEIEKGLELISELKEYASKFEKTPIPVSKLRVGLKCGGSDGFSGITANPLLGRFSDTLCSFGGAAVLTEVPEMFGAEHLLMQRAENELVFEKTVSLINNFKDYYRMHNQVVYENPSPGNKAGGITTLEEKSLGCVQKGGLFPVSDVLDYGEALKTSGVSLLNGPGNDIVAITNLTASGVHLILFTTGRGTPLGAPVPTIKVATNSTLAKNKKSWIDFDASGVLEGKNLDGEFFDYVLSVASGLETKNEENDYREISIFKDGVTL